MSEVFIRDAVREDAPFIGMCVTVALHSCDFGEEMDPQQKMFTDSCVVIGGQEDMLYSYRNTRIAMIDGEIAGGLIAYPGDGYIDCRNRTWTLLHQMLGIPPFQESDAEPETRPGEFYLDSLAVKPEFRSLGVAHLLIMDAIGKGRSLGYHRFSLIVEKATPALVDYYATFGFVAGEEINFFGSRYIRMTLVDKLD